MPLGWNEIRSRAVAFSKEWECETREHAEAKSFWDDFFRVFGLTRRHLASFEEPVKKLSGNYGYIDLFWKGMLLAEHKSAGKDLSKAQSQAAEYVQALINEGRADEAPRYIILSDFARIALHDLETGDELVFPLEELHERIDCFAFIPGYKQHSFEAEDPINLQAVQIMGDLHDALEEGGYKGHELERMLVRILFCLFAEDTGIFDRSAFQLYLENHTQADGSDMGATLSQIFHVLNTPEANRQSNLSEELAGLPYVNGELFSEFLGFPQFNREMRERLLSCTRFDWSRISPAVFGALFQSVMEPTERRQIGAHYTSERDILKVIGPLFLDELRQELAAAGKKAADLKRLHERIADMRLLDPACGCGNFLVIAYRELRLIELEILKRLNPGQRQRLLDMAELMQLDVDQMYGIEIEEWPARIAEVAMWLMDHQMNLRYSQAFGQYVVRLPLKKSPHIRIENALKVDWKSLIDPSICTHILGNPPFIGSKYQSDEQRSELREVTGNLKNGGILDYVTGWYFKATDYIKNTDIPAAFVSTNSISQGEQVSVLWGALINQHNIHIRFAHRTFEWQSEARGKAHVHVVIVGFALKEAKRKYLFDYETLRSEPKPEVVANINPYLVEGPDIVAESRSKPLCPVPEIGIGNKPIDDGNYLFTDEEKENFVSIEPKSEELFRRWFGSREFINRSPRWCLWLGDCAPNELKAMPHALERVDNVRRFRLKSKSKPTQAIAERPTRFHVENFPEGTYLLIPKVSSERRRFIPIGFLTPDVLCSDLVFVMRDATLFHFGVLSSTLHMSWVRTVCGRLKSDYRYSAKLVYNNFPWPADVDDKKREAVELAAQNVLNVRDDYPDASLADLYDPRTMPSILSKAHAALDRTVDRCYRPQKFTTERNRVEYLFNLYEKLTSPITAASKKKSSRKQKLP